MNYYSKYIAQYQTYVVVVADSEEHAYEILETDPSRVWMYKRLPDNKVKWISANRQFPDDYSEPHEFVIQLE